MANSLLNRQLDVLKTILNFNESSTKPQPLDLQWKVLILDRVGQEIVSPLLSVKDLRDLGVTLHLPLMVRDREEDPECENDRDRDPLPDVPAVYIVSPTDANIRRICKDLENGLYESYFLNFLSPLPRQRLELLAECSIRCEATDAVKKVFDQYCNFVCLEEDLFVLKHPQIEQMSYQAFNRSEVSETDIELIMESIAECLFSVFVTLGSVPIIRSPRGNAAELVAERLDRKLRDNLKDQRGCLFTGADISSSVTFGGQRPLLIVLDRNMDLATPLHHSWTYQALVHDVLAFNNNRVTLEAAAAASSEPLGDGDAEKKEKEKKKKPHTYDLSTKDRFWQQHKSSPFPSVADAVQQELDAYKAQEGQVKQLKQAMGLEPHTPSADAPAHVDPTNLLSNAVSALPELLEQKRLIDMHTNIASALLQHIKKRKLDTYFEVEEKLLSKSSLEKSVLDFLLEASSGEPDDKLRLAMIAVLSASQLTDADRQQYVSALQAAGCNLSPFNYIMRAKTFSKGSGWTTNAVGGDRTAVKTESMFSRLMQHGSQFFMEGVKNLVVKKHNLPVTRILDALVDSNIASQSYGMGRAGSAAAVAAMQAVGVGSNDPFAGVYEEYRYMDPKILRPTAENSIPPRVKQPFSEVFVFVVGGGNYIEYHNLLEYLHSKSGGPLKRITYGCTQLMNANQFLKQLTILGMQQAQL